MNDEGVGEIVQVLRRGGPMTKRDVADSLELSRSAVSARVDRGLASGAIVVVGYGPSRGGRRPELLSVNDGPQLLALADIAGSSFRVAIADTAGRILASEQHEVPVSRGPKVILRLVEEGHRRLVDGYIAGDAGAAGRTSALAGLLAHGATPYSWAAGIAVSLPGPIDSMNSLPVGAPIIQGWDEFDVVGHFRARSDGVPIFLDNDVNAMAFAELVVNHPDAELPYMLKAGTGIGSAIVWRGEVVRGARGAAGDIAHSPVVDEGLLPGADLPRCRCGNVGCVEAIAGGWALVRESERLGAPMSSVAELVSRARASDPIATRLIREAGRHLGYVVASAVALLNPDVVVVAGQLTEAHDHLMAGLRAAVYSRVQPLASDQLQIVPGALGHLTGVIGLAQQLIRRLPSPAAPRGARTTSSRNPALVGMSAVDGGRSASLGAGGNGTARRLAAIDEKS